MPYQLFQTIKDGEKKFGTRNKLTGHETLYSSPEARIKGILFRLRLELRKIKEMGKSIPAELAKEYRHFNK